MPGKLKSDSKSKQKATSRKPSSSKVAKSKDVKPSNTRKGNKNLPVESRAIEEEDDEEEQEEDEETGSEEESEDEEGDDNDDDDDDDGVDEGGMKKLMKALGEDGLDDVGRMQLDALEGEDEDGEDDDEDSEIDEGDEDGDMQIQELVEADSDEESESDDEEGSVHGEAELDEDDDDDDDEVALEDAESVDEDAVPRQKIITNNKVALERIRDTIKLDASLPWTETLTVTYPETISVDVNDDLNRELAFYKQALHGASTAHTLASTHTLPFTRPPDYFAEMVKSDAHMERIRQRLLDETAALKRSEEKRREREGKKYGKQVQIEKIKERERSKKEMEERLKGLKRKHKDALDDTTANADDSAFDIAVEDALSSPHPSKRSKPNASGGGKKRLSRKGRDAKFGFGSGKGRRDKQNTRKSTENFEFSSGKKGGGKKAGKGEKQKRLGKSRRMAQAGKKR
ncbi:Ebp2-domain-containing protein [Fomitiporia mediterranea MF3/22]|uniref:Ebp2-domain-containing protein n=1 Tax=Fomitiporia mediterranea (strain MF3/22) TaxID=694068 RepID=UPI0004409BE4|nr:Ebp2-domain-containing protein [Fomitiporia mediterranea MF3/22]EJC99019.1 Ebp2-domain-containing protein [Fomitiporia mediterranea MF3/22]